MKINNTFIPTTWLQVSWEWDWDYNDRAWTNNGIATNITYATSVKWYTSEEWSFNWTSSVVTSTSTQDLHQSSDDFTVNAWIKPWTTQVSTAIIVDYDHWNATPANRGFVCQQNATTTNNFTFFFWDWSTYQSTWAFNLTASVWQMLTVVKSWTTMTTYVGNVSVSSWTVPATVNKPTTKYALGAFLATPWTREFTWSINLFKFYNQALTEEERNSLFLEWNRLFWPTNLLFNNTDFTKYSLPNLQDWLVLDISRAAVSWTYYDQSWNGNNWTETWTIDDTTKGLNNVMTFSWVNEYIANTTTALTLWQTLTVSFWVKPWTQINAVSHIVDLNHNDTGVSGGEWNWTILNVTTWSPLEYYFSYWNWSSFQWNLKVLFTANEWQLYTVTYASNSVKQYLNWILQTTQTTTGSISYANTQHQWIWNANSYLIDREFVWDISSIKIYNRALSVNEVQQLRYSNFLKN